MFDFAGLGDELNGLKIIFLALQFKLPLHH